MQLEEASKLLPIHRPPLTATVEPFPQYPGHSVEEPPYMCQVEGHPVIADVSPYFGTERGPEGGEALLILPRARPLLDPLELRPESFPAGFHLGNRRPFARPPPVEEEAQKLEGTLRLPSPGCLFGEGGPAAFSLHGDAADIWRAAVAAHGEYAPHPARTGNRSPHRPHSDRGRPALDNAL